MVASSRSKAAVGASWNRRGEADGGRVGVDGGECGAGEDGAAEGAEGFADGVSGVDTREMELGGARGPEKFFQGGIREPLGELGGLPEDRRELRSEGG